MQLDSLRYTCNCGHPYDHHQTDQELKMKVQQGQELKITDQDLAEVRGEINQGKELKLTDRDSNGKDQDLKAHQLLAAELARLRTELEAARQELRQWERREAEREERERQRRTRTRRTRTTSRRRTTTRRRTRRKERHLRRRQVAAVLQGGVTSYPALRGLEEFDIYLEQLRLDKAVSVGVLFRPPHDWKASIWTGNY